EAASVPVGLDLLAVAGHARLLLDDRLATPHDAVQQRGLADVGSADDGDDGEGHGGRLRPPPPEPAAGTVPDGTELAAGSHGGRTRGWNGSVRDRRGRGFGVGQGVTAARRATPWVGT